jgi:hypothetical protein
MAMDVVAALSDDPWQRAADRVMRSVKSESKRGPSAEKLGNVALALVGSPVNAIDSLMQYAATSRPGENEALAGPAFNTALDTIGMGTFGAMRGAAGAAGGKLIQPSGVATTITEQLKGAMADRSAYTGILSAIGSEKRVTINDLRQVLTQLGMSPDPRATRDRLLRDIDMVQFRQLRFENKLK